MGERENTAPYAISKAVPKTPARPQTMLQRGNTLNLPLRESTLMNKRLNFEQTQKTA
jgi:hypothetical protein